MKKIFFYLLTFLCLSGMLTGCENKRDDNGDLGGMWQMTRWTDKEGTVVYTMQPDATIYYKVYNSLFMFQELPSGISHYFLSYFQTYGDSIRFEHLVNYPTDTLAGFHELARYGIPLDGKVRIKKLNSKNMILDSKAGTLYFRKY